MKPLLRQLPHFERAVSTWFKVPTVLAEHEVVADVEGPPAKKSASIVRVSPTPAICLPGHVTGEFGFVEIVRTHQFKDGEIGGAVEWLESVHR